MQEHAVNSKIDTHTFSQTHRRDPLSVGYFSPDWPPEVSSNGIVTYVASMLKGIEGLGHQSYVVTPPFDDSTELKHDSQNVFQLPRRPPGGMVGYLINAVTRRIRPGMPFKSGFARAAHESINTIMSGSRLDIFEMEESFGSVGFLSDRLPIPVVVRLHGPWFLNGKAMGVQQDQGFLQRVQDERQAIAKAFAITAPSRDVLDQTRQYYNLPLERAVVIPCPIASTPREQRWRSDDCEPNTIAFIGRFDRHKGGDLVIDAFAQVLRECPKTRLLFAGPDRGCIDDDGRVWHLEEYIRDRIPGALEAGQVSCLGQQPPSKLRELRRRAQVTIVASRYDNFPYTALEALSLGCPIVGACAGGIPEIVADGVSGLLFQAGNADDLAAKVIRLLKNPDLAAQLGHQAGESCAEQFSPEVVAKQSIDFYRETLERWSQSRNGSLKATTRL
ncbi:glycosyltransferase family 4 protein [Phormidium sp. FACHB-592]|uniref:Glycosyltransferase family 4 protein n=1 Tax=Stenomitos frigidus AS-A4 TaxID=2933935 RepID=A0ABV0KLG2_9CYAN|nr:glycosyltransferase family 4 protein [Phormidium sp. FACHB-592]MBD2075037.1 glycosyltransferase family 4 protein [Phormidium sp. FACHB-592]